MQAWLSLFTLDLSLPALCHVHRHNVLRPAVLSLAGQLLVSGLSLQLMPPGNCTNGPPWCFNSSDAAHSPVWPWARCCPPVQSDSQLSEGRGNMPCLGRHTMSLACGCHNKDFSNARCCMQHRALPGWCALIWLSTPPFEVSDVACKVQVHVCVGMHSVLRACVCVNCWVAHTDAASPRLEDRMFPARTCRKAVTAY
jgi:hypothetical protein